MLCCNRSFISQVQLRKIFLFSFLGTSEPVLRDHLSFMDSEDTDSEIQITLTIQTVHGKLLLYNKQVMNRGRFTQADINDGHLRLVWHSCSRDFQEILIYCSLFFVEVHRLSWDNMDAQGHVRCHYFLVTVTNLFALKMLVYVQWH